MDRVSLRAGVGLMCALATGLWAEEKPVRQVKWDFDNLEGWNQECGEAPKSNYTLKDGALRIATRPKSRDRVKVASKQGDFGAGTYTWRVFVPAMGLGDQASIGAFLYRDDAHEFDFEIGSGTAKVRKELKAGKDDLVCYCTSQKHPYSSGTFLIASNQWHTLTLDLQYGENKKYLVRWLIDGKEAKRLQTTFGDEIQFFVYCSVENLLFLGDHLPPNETYALFDSVEFAAREKAK